MLKSNRNLRGELSVALGREPTLLFLVQFGISIVIGNSIGAAVSLAFFGVILHLPASALLPTFLGIALLGLCLPPLILWVRLGRPVQTRFAFRSALCAFVYIEIIAGPMVSGAVRLHLINGKSLLNWYGLLAAIVGLLLALTVFIVNGGARSRRA